MIYNGIIGVPEFMCIEFEPRKSKYCVCIPIINEGERIIKELKQVQKYGINNQADIVVCDGGSSDGSTRNEIMEALGVNSLLVKKGPGKQGAQLRMGFWWALERGYEGIITVDGNNKDSMETIPLFIEKLDEGYDFIQGSRFVKGGNAINTPLFRLLSVKIIHAPITSLTAHYHFTDTTNAFRGHSRKYLTHQKVQPFRDVFMTYELLAYLSTRATQLGLKVCEIPVTRTYPKKEKVPTKISFLKGNYVLLEILLLNMVGKYNPK